MNGKHPIDDLFARGLRDAEATPPPGVWEGIVRERGKTSAPPGKQAAAGRKRGRWGLAALFLLFLSAATYWLLDAPDKTSADAQASAQPLPEKAGTSVAAPAEHGHGQAMPTPADPQQVTPASASTPTLGQQPAPLPGRATPSPEGAQESRAAAVSKPASHVQPSTYTDGQRAERSKKRSTDLANVISATVQTVPNGEASNHGESGETNGANTRTFVPTRTGAEDPASEVAAASKDPRTGRIDVERSARMESETVDASGRATPDVHLPTLTGRVTPFMNSPVSPLGPILPGDSIAPYVLRRGQLWFALQAEWAKLNGEWKGPGPEVTALNASETWREGRGLGIAFGYEWLSGWSLGLNVGMNRQQARFLRREVEEAQAQVVIDTTWTASPLGDPTNYTWDIVQTVVEEPVVERVYSATNTYTRLRIAPEAGYRFAQMKRFGLSVRLAPVFMMEISRKGGTVTGTVVADTSETAPSTMAVPLDDPSLDKRSAFSMAMSAGFELRYRLCDRWSVSALPTFTYWLPRTGTDRPTLSMNELGGAVRLRYDLRHKERRVK